MACQSVAAEALNIYHLEPTDQDGQLGFSTIGPCKAGTGKCLRPELRLLSRVPIRKRCAPTVPAAHFDVAACPLGKALLGGFQWLDSYIPVPSFRGGPTMDLQPDDSFLFDRLIGLGVIDRLLAI